MHIDDLRCPDCGKLATDMDDGAGICERCNTRWDLLVETEAYNPVLLAALSSTEAEHDAKVQREIQRTCKAEDDFQIEMSEHPKCGCGGVAVLTPPKRKGWWAIRCGGCGLEMHTLSEWEAWQAWDRIFAAETKRADDAERHGMDLLRIVCECSSAAGAGDTPLAQVPQRMSAALAAERQAREAAERRVAELEEELTVEKSAFRMLSESAKHRGERIEALKAERDAALARVAGLEAENATLRAGVEHLAQRIDELEQPRSVASDGIELID